MGVYNDLFGIPERVGKINSKRKGNSNEYQLALWLTKWVGTKFGRVPASGGLRWQGESRFIGDVVAQDEKFNFPFTVETKSYNALRLKNGNFSKKVLKFWEQCLEDCIRSKKLPMLAMRENGMTKDTWYIFMEEDILNYYDLAHVTYIKIGDIKFFCINSYYLRKIDYVKFLSLIKKD